MYLHGNAEDLGLSHDLLKAFRDFLNVHVLGVEYPGYGPVPGNPCEGGVNRHTRAAFNFLTQKLRIPPSASSFSAGPSGRARPRTWCRSCTSSGSKLRP